MRNANDGQMLVLLGAVSTVAIVAAVQQPDDTIVLMAAGGFMLFTAAWVGMYFRLKREVPDHALVDAPYFDVWGRRRGARSMVQLIRVHFARRRFDLWTLALVAGLLLLAIAAAAQLAPPRS
jgi:hypothetical protein